MRYIVEVTYGTMRNQIYACVKSVRAARRLQDAAVARGYHDARIVDARDIGKTQGPPRSGAARAGKAARRAS